ncbi:sodium/solute symporter [candidate division KSB1 bacterium]|nr:sodium/solute symporter [candidate division KSB1 bacterium]
MRTKNSFKLFSLFLLINSTLFLQSCGNQSSGVNDVVRKKAVNELHTVLKTQSQWVKVHAAEYLLALSYPDSIKEIFLDELQNYGTTPQYRIGIWRTLARASYDANEKQKWIDHIWDSFLDDNSPDRMHAAETLSKLNENLLSRNPKIAMSLAQGDDKKLAAFVSWGMAVNSDNQLYINQLVGMLNSDDLETRKLAAYGIRLNIPINPEQWDVLYQAAINEPDSSSAAVYLVGAALVRLPEQHESDEIRAQLDKRLRKFMFSKTKENRFHACEALAANGAIDDVQFLTKLLNGKSSLQDDTLSPDILAAQNADVRSAAANAILRIYRRLPHKMAFADWFVIALYGIGMLTIGWYYAGRTKSSEDYNLGGRNMNPVMVGLSLFASILSTLSYLAYPGEMIKNGPIYFLNLLVFPLVYIIVGWLFIPIIMRMKVTSANEILEIKLGGSVRLLGTFFFLSLRLLWMATIIYATVDNILLPIFGINSQYLPLICAAMGIVTLAYTSMGGLRAVVLTDVIQTVILIGGIIVTIVLISIHFGGVSAWLPSDWPVHWPKAKFGFDPTTRVTMANAMLMVFMWYICTAGSDQIAIQRYLATKDAKSARHTFGISVATNLVVQVLLGLAGLALLAFFTAAPNLLPDGNTIFSVSDRLFSQFILLKLPVGITGLLTAGLMAAAMSSLSSGMNSSATVISEDIIKRFTRDRFASDEQQLRHAKYTAFVIGTVVVIISMFLGNVQGNLLDILIKVVNLFVGPLFLLFFMAMFIPWATATGTFIGGLSCTAIAIAISFYNIFGIAILWSLPISFAGGVVIGIMFSFLSKAIAKQ